MAKGFSGQTTALGRLVPGLNQAALKSGDMGKVLDELKSKTDGAAKAAGDSAAGKMKRFQNSLGETQEAIGGALLPVLDKLSGLLVTVGQWAQDHGTLFTVIAAGVAVFAGAIVALNLAVTIYTAVTTLAGSATLMAWLPVLLPILAVAAAVAAVIIVVVLLWKRCSAFRNAVLAIWAAIKVAITAVGNAIRKVGAIASTVFSWIKSHWKLLASILGGPFVAAAILIISNFARIRSVISSVLGWIKSAWHAAWGSLRAVTAGALSGIREVVSSLVEWVRGKWSGMVDAISSAMHGLAAILRAPFDAAKSAIQGVINLVENLIGALGRIHVPKINLPGPLGRAVGLSAPAVAAPGVGAFAAPAVATPRAGAGSSARGGGTVINIYGAVDPEGTARQVQRLLSGHDRRIGLRVS
jgi:phage-related protein